MDEILVTVYGYKESYNPHYYSVWTVLSGMKDGYIKSRISRYWNNEIQKDELPVIIFSASEMKGIGKIAENVSKHSGLILIDIDRGKNKHVDMFALKQRVSADPHTLSCFISPSQNGLKILLKTNIESISLHEIYFEHVKNYIEKTYNIIVDTSGSNVNRLCFISFDENIYINISSTIFILSEEDIRNSVIATPIDYIGSLSGNSDQEFKFEKGVITTPVSNIYDIYSNIFSRYRYKVIMVGNDPFFYLLQLQYDSNYINYRTTINEELFAGTEDNPLSIEEGVYYCEIGLKGNSTRIQKGKRNKTIANFAIKLIFNNPFASFNRLLEILNMLNEHYCREPLTNKEVWNILSYNYNRFMKGKLKFGNYVRRKYVFHSRLYQWKDIDIVTAIKIKQKEAFQAYIQGKLSRGEKLIYNTIEFLMQKDKVITVGKLHNECGLSESTIKRYLRRYEDSLKSIIDTHNAEIRKTKKKKVKSKTSGSSPKKIKKIELCTPSISDCENSSSIVHVTSNDTGSISSTEKREKVTMFNTSITPAVIRALFGSIYQNEKFSHDKRIESKFYRLFEEKAKEYTHHELLLINQKHEILKQEDQSIRLKIILEFISLRSEFLRKSIIE